MAQQVRSRWFGHQRCRIRRFGDQATFLREFREARFGGKHSSALKRLSAEAAEPNKTSAILASSAFDSFPRPLLAQLTRRSRPDRFIPRTAYRRSDMRSHASAATRLLVLGRSSDVRCQNISASPARKFHTQSNEVVWPRSDLLRPGPRAACSAGEMLRGAPRARPPASLRQGFGGPP
jgi:hypothetical protein